MLNKMKSAFDGKKLISILSFAVIAVAFFSLITVVSATKTQGDFVSNNQGRGDDNEHNSGNFNPDKQLSKSACGENLKDPIINVTQKVQNDVDSGVAGFWAFDYYTRHIKVWQTVTGVEGSNTYCATVVYDGKFYAVPGQEGPGGVSGALINTATNAPVNGDMSGGRRVTITGTLLSTPVTGWPNFGTVTPVSNYKCDIAQNCPGYDTLYGVGGSWVNKYFSGTPGYSEDWWGWKYNGGSHGMWINSSDGNSGNIL